MRTTESPVVHTSDDVFVPASPREVQLALLHLHEDGSWWQGARARGGFAWVELDAPTGRRRERIRFKARVEDAREWDGFRWVFESGELSGHAEVWLEPFRSGTIVHYLTSTEGNERALRAALRRHRWAIRIGLNGLKDVFARAQPGTH